MGVRLLMLVSVSPLGNGAGNLITYVVLWRHNPYPPRTQLVNGEQTRPCFTPDQPLAPRCVPHLHMFILVRRRDSVRPVSPGREPPLAPLPGDPGLPTSPRRTARAPPEGGPGEAQALIPTGLVSSCSRIRRAPAVLSARERPGEPGVRGGDVCVRPGAGERAGERG